MKLQLQVFKSVINLNYALQAGELWFQPTELLG